MTRDRDLLSILILSLQANEQYCSRHNV